ncbi:glycosyltransferase involved in cell wall biosynthesis [Flavobacteriaceae bacterium MAR_2010_72]|nr:glycosyltransferase involved in cell wall biosynthesis [Flavobacteriaceae bacterium MAR_2010_72]
MKVKLSIITINYNNLKGLERTMPSVLAQRYEPLEYLVIDGGSTDGSTAYIASQEAALAYWVSEPDKGVYHAMNKGINKAKGEYLLFLNSGDTFYSQDALSHFKPYLTPTNSFDLLYGDLNVISEKEWIKTYPETLEFSYFVKDTLPHPATLIKRSCFRDFLYDEHLKIASDWKFFMLGICKKKFSYQYINTIIANFYLDGISSRSPALVKLERDQVLQREFALSFNFYRLNQYLKRAIKLK